MVSDFDFFHLPQDEDWKKNRPDTEWMKSLIPDVEIAKFRSGLIKFGDGIKGKANEIDIGNSTVKHHNLN